MLSFIHARDPKETCTLKLILRLLIVPVLTILAVGLLLPREYRVERSILVEAPREVVFYQVDDPGRWERWFPWFSPDNERDRSGPYTGVGAKVTWRGEDSRPEYRMITSSKRDSRIETKLDLGEMGELNEDWSFEPTDSGASVVWKINGIAGGVFGGYLARSMDHRLGPDMEHGLSKLKMISEGFDHGDRIGGASGLDEVVVGEDVR